MIIWLNVILTLFIFKDVLADVSITESGGEVKRPGDSLRLTCTSSGFNIDSYWMQWVRQADGKGLEWISQINKGTTYYANSFKGRFIISKDSSRNLVYLDMNGLKSEDTAKYYCTRRWLQLGAYFDHWGQGTLVSISSDPPKAPTVFPLTPSGPTSTDHNVSLGCLVKGYFPEPATVQWNSGAITTGIHHFPPVRHASGQYTHTSLLTIPTTQWESESFFCDVEHEATNSSINKHVGRKSKAPIVHIYPPIPGNSLILTSFVRGFYPAEINIQWQKNGQDIPENDYVNTPAVKEKSGDSHFKYSKLTIADSDWNLENTFSCRVIHEAKVTQRDIAKTSGKR